MARRFHRHAVPAPPRRRYPLPRLREHRAHLVGPHHDFPLVDVKAPKAKPSPRGEPDAKPLPPEGAEPFTRASAFTPIPCARRIPAKRWSIPPLPPSRQRFFPTFPISCNSSRQLARAPRLQIGPETLSKLRPPELRKVKFTSAPAPDLPPWPLAGIAPAMRPTLPPAKVGRSGAGAEVNLTLRSSGGRNLESVSGPIWRRGRAGPAVCWNCTILGRLGRIFGGSGERRN